MTKFLAIFLTIILNFNYQILALAQENPQSFQNPKATSKKLNKPSDSIKDPSSDLDKDSAKIPNKQDFSRYGTVAIVQALNKTTAKTSILELKIGEKISFGSLRIITHKCWQSPLEQRPENKILLEIFEAKNLDSNETSENRIFYGWMFSSSPSISGLEHPIYDITAINCKNK